MTPFIVPRSSFLVLLLLLLAGPLSAATPQSIVNSPHNLSASGPGTIRATTEAEVCVFCHTPHNATPVQPLWNRTLSVASYKPYSSSSLKATPGQPTGSSKLCLSCHDGTIAIGSVQSRSQPITIAGGITTLTSDHGSLGTDLSGDHPISFRYDSALVLKNPKLLNPQLLTTTAFKLDANRELQCTTCHDPHNNTNTQFLVVANNAGSFCKTCHNQGITDPVAHQDCGSCHQPHTSPSGPYLLVKAKVTDTCVQTCHNGAGGVYQGPNIGTTLTLLSLHDTGAAVDQPGHIPGSVTCEDCHEPHTVRAVTALAPNISGYLGRAAGVTAAGGTTTPAQFEYEVCFKCHADQSAVTPFISRQLVQSNTRLEFAAGAVAYHPVVAAGKNTFVPSLRPPYTTTSIIGCTDCHGSNTSKKAGGSGANGPHGSAVRPLLLANYQTADRTPESSTAYALCYTCHDRNSLLADASFPKHHVHISNQQAPCSTCHTGHGIAAAQGTAANNFALINFDTTIVFKDGVTGRLEFDHTGNRTGKCYLKCHNVNHSPKSY